MTRALSQVGHADYRANAPSGHVHGPACYVASEGPTAAPVCGFIGDPDADIDNDEDFRQSSLSDYDVAMGNLRDFLRARAKAEGTVGK